MYIFKNALRSIWRSKGRNILIGIIALAIAISACIALSIKESAAKAREDTLKVMTITAKISVDRNSMMKGAMPEMGENGEQPEFDRDALKELLRGGSELTLEEYETYAEAKSVKGSYYSMSVTLDASGDLEPIDTMGTFEPPSSDDSSSQQMPEGFQNFGGGMPGGFGGKMGTQGDFTVVGYSSDEAMTDFVQKLSSVPKGNGKVFEENTSKNDCIISEELALLNNLSVGDKITLANPNNTEETFELKIVGIYTGEQESSNGVMGGFSTATDPANKIMMSYKALKAICDKSNESAETITDEDTGMETSTAVQSSLDYTYVFESKEDYEAFADEAKELGLSDDYSISSTDADSFEDSLVPLEDLAETASSFLLVVLIIGAVILVVINIFNIRERKYEIGVLTAIGMKKRKVAVQFVTELFVVTLISIIIGTAIGAAVSVPVTNKLLADNITANQQEEQEVTDGFGRDTQIQGGGMTQMTPPNMPNGNNMQQPPSNGDFGNFVDGVKDTTKNVISEISYATDITVVVKLMGVGVLLTLASSLSAVLFIMRYEPLKILTSRD